MGLCAVFIALTHPSLSTIKQPPVSLHTSDVMAGFNGTIFAYGQVGLSSIALTFEQRRVRAPTA